MEPTPPPPLSATAAANAATVATYPASVDASPRSRNTDSSAEDNSIYPSNNTNNGSTAAPLPLTKLRLMCSYGGHIVPRPHDKSLCYVGGDTRIVVVDRHTTLSDLTHRLSKLLLRSSSSSSLTSTTNSFTIKYQLPSEDLDSLISVTTDEDLEIMIDEYERLNSSPAVNKSSRLRVFIFPAKSESVSSIGSLLESSIKSEDWFLNVLNGATSGFSDTSSVNCLLGLDDDVLIQERKDVNNKDAIGNNLRGNNSSQDVRSVPESPMIETTSSFGSASSTPSLANLPPIRLHVDDHPKVGGGIEEQFSQMSIPQQHHRHQEDAAFVAAPIPAVVSGAPVISAAGMAENPVRRLSNDERSEQGLQMSNQTNQLQQQQQQQQYQQNQALGFDLASPDSVSSDGSITNPLSRQLPPMIYQDPMIQIQTSSNNNNRAVDLNNIPDQNARIQMQQQQKIPDSAYLMSMPSNKADPQHPQLHHQPQFIHTAVPPPQYIHHHPSGAVPMASYYQMYPSKNQRHAHQPALDQQNFMYYMPARQMPQGYNMPLQHQPSPPQPSYGDSPSAAAVPPPHNQAPATFAAIRTVQTASKNESPSGVYRTSNSGAPELVQVPASQQHQPQYMGYSQIHHPSQSVASSSPGAGGNYGYEYSDPSQQGQHVYYAAQPLPPQSAAQFQTMKPTSPVEAASHLSNDSSSKQQQLRTPQP